MMFSATFNNISVIHVSWRSVLLSEETGVPGENHRPASSHCFSCILLSGHGLNSSFIDIYI